MGTICFQSKTAQIELILNLMLLISSALSQHCLPLSKIKLLLNKIYVIKQQRWFEYTHDIFDVLNIKIKFNDLLFKLYYTTVYVIE